MSESIVQKRGSSKGKSKKKSENLNENVVDTATKSLEPIPDHLKCEVSPKKSRKKRVKDQKNESSTPLIDEDGRGINNKEVKIERPQQLEVGDGVCVENRKGKPPEKQNRLLVIKEESDLNTSCLENVTKSVGSKSNSELQTLKKDDGILQTKENNGKKPNKKRRLEDGKEKNVETVPPEKLINNEESKIIVRAQNSKEVNVFPTTVENEDKPKKRRKRRNTKQKPGLECASSEQLISDSVELINGKSSNHDNIQNQNTKDVKDPADYEEESHFNSNIKKDVGRISQRKRSADSEIKEVEVISEDVQRKVDAIDSTQSNEIVKSDSANSMSKRRRRNKNKLRNEEQSVTEEEEVSNKKDQNVEEEKGCKNQMARQVKSEVYEENEENISNQIDDCEIVKKSKRRRRKVNASRSALLIRADSNGTNQSLFQNNIEHEKRAAALRRKPSEIYNQKYTEKIQANQCLGLYNESQDKIEKNNEVSTELPITNSDELELSPILKVPSINNVNGYPNSSESVNQENNVEVHKTYADKVKESSVKIEEESKLVFILRGVDDSKQSFEISMEDQKKCKKSKSKTKQFKPISPPILECNCESNEYGTDCSHLFLIENEVQKNTKRSTRNIDHILATSTVENNDPDDKKIPVEDVRENDDSLQHAERNKKVKKRRVKPASEPDNQIIYSHSTLLGTNIEDNTISTAKVGKEVTFKIVGKKCDEFDGNINQDDELPLKKSSEDSTQHDDCRNKKSKSKKKKRNVSQIETPEVSPVNEGTVNDGTLFQSSSEQLAVKSEVDYIMPVESSSSVSQNSTINEEAVSRHSKSIKPPKNVEKDERKRGKLKKDKPVKNEIESKKIKIQNSNKNPIPSTDSITDSNQPACLFNEAAVSSQNYQHSVSNKRDSIIPEAGQCETTKYDNSSKTDHHLNPLEIPKYDLFAISEAEKRFAKLLYKEHNNNDSSNVPATESDKFPNFNPHLDSLEIPKYDLFAISEAEKRFAKLLYKEHNNNDSSNVPATESDKLSNFNPHLDSLEIPKYDLFAISDAEKRFAKLLESVHNASQKNNNCYNILTTKLDNGSTNDSYIKATDELHVNRSEEEFGEIPDGTSKIVNPDLQTRFSDNFSSRPTTASSCDKKSSAQKMCSWSQVAATEAKTKSDDSQDHASENQHKSKQKSLEFSKPVRIKVCDRVASRVNISLAEDSEGFIKYVSKREMRKQRSRTSSRSDDEDVSQAVESIQNKTSNNITKESDTEEEMISDSNGSDSIKPSKANTGRITLDSVWIKENSESKENYRERQSEGIETSASDTDDNSGSRSSETHRQRKKSKSIIFESTVIVHTNTSSHSIVHTNTSSHSMGIDIKRPSSASDTSASDTDDNCGSRSSSETRSTLSRKRRKSRGKKRNLDDGSGGGTDLRARPGSTCILDGQPIHLDSEDVATASGESNDTIPEDNTDKIENDESPEERNDSICDQKPNSPRIKELFVMIFMELYLLLIYYATGLGKKKPE